MNLIIFPNKLNIKTVWLVLNSIPIPIKIDNKIIGSRLYIIFIIDIFSIKPPTNNPIGIAIIPHNIPLNKLSSSSFFTKPIESGSVKLMVHPNMDDINIPENILMLLSFAKFEHKLYPPISTAIMLPKKIDGSINILLDMVISTLLI